MTHDDRIELARKLRLGRQEAGMSQAEAASVVGLSRVAIAEIEAGRRKVSSTELSAFSRAYGQPVEALLETHGDQVAGGAPVMTYLARTVKQLTKEDQDQLLRFAQYLKTESKRRRESDG